MQCARSCDLMSSCDDIYYDFSSRRCFLGPSMRNMNDSASVSTSRYRRCPISAGYTVHSGRCLKLQRTLPTSDAVARDNCSADGGHLFDIVTELDKEVLFSFIMSQDSVPNYLNLGAKRRKGVFYWTDNSTLSDDHYLWKSSEPNNWGGVEGCVGLKVATLQLHDVRCHTEVKGFVCQIDLD
ncbi:C-type isolectin Sp-CL4-like [Littorina saxatilis]|uniref:C-type isolectin Sp-CL4-like n=1 Tax=Littorina saxatilis TaxID=31220 RepID=UPI0038B6A59E